MVRVSKRTLDWIYSFILLFIVLLSWGFVIYASKMTAIRYLEENLAHRIL